MQIDKSALIVDFDADKRVKKMCSTQSVHVNENVQITDDAAMHSQKAIVKSCLFFANPHKVDTWMCINWVPTCRVVCVFCCLWLWLIPVHCRCADKVAHTLNFAFHATADRRVNFSAHRISIISSDMLHCILSNGCSKKHRISSEQTNKLLHRMIAIHFCNALQWKGKKSAVRKNIKSGCKLASHRFAYHRSKRWAFVFSKSYCELMQKQIHATTLRILFTVSFSLVCVSQI